MTPEQLDGWMAADALYGFLGDEKLVWTMARVGAYLTLCLTDKAEIKPSDFVPGAGDSTPQTVDEQMALFAVMAEQQNARF